MLLRGVEKIHFDFHGHVAYIVSHFFANSIIVKAASQRATCVACRHVLTIGGSLAGNIHFEAATLAAARKLAEASHETLMSCNAV